MDGPKVYIEQSGDALFKGMFYNGWKSDHYATRVFGFSPAGTVNEFSENCPGSIRDSKISDRGGVYDK